MNIDNFSLRSQDSYTLVSNMLSRMESLDDSMFWDLLKAEWLNNSQNILLNNILLPFLDDGQLDIDITFIKRPDESFIRQMISHWIDLAYRHKDLVHLSPPEYELLYLDSFVLTSNVVEFLIREFERSEIKYSILSHSVKRRSSSKYDLRTQEDYICKSFAKRSMSNTEINSSYSKIDSQHLVVSSSMSDSLALEFFTYLNNLDRNLCTYILLEGPKTIPSRFKDIYKNLIQVFCQVHKTFLPTLMQIKRDDTLRPFDYDGTWCPNATCQICFQTMGAFVNRCCNDPVCETCLSAYLNIQVSDHGRIHIQCPFPECGSPVKYQQIWLRLTQANRTRYEVIRNNLTQTEVKKLCPHCMEVHELSALEVGLLKKKTAKKKFKRGFNVQCGRCQCRWCFICQSPAHDTMSCKKNLSADKLLMKWARSPNDVHFLATRTARRCPKCHVLVERNGGCPHMECVRCNCSWCFDCGRRRFAVTRIPFMNHDSRFFILGCSRILLPNNDHLRRLIRLSALGGLVLGVSVIITPALALLLAASVLVGLPLGVYLLIKRAKHRCRDRN